MNGTDPSPQDIFTEEGLIEGHKVKALLYNEQVTDSLTSTFLAEAKKARVPVVGVYETMPVPGYDYQSWMLAEVEALQRAVARGTSAVELSMALRAGLNLARETTSTTPVAIAPALSVEGFRCVWPDARSSTT